MRPRTGDDTATFAPPLSTPGPAGSFLSERTVEGNVRRIFDKLGLADTPQDNRRVLAVLAFLRA